MKRSVRNLAAAVIVIAVSGSYAGTAFASPGPTSTAATGTSLAAIKAQAATSISARLGSLNSAITDINANPIITATDRSTLLNTLNGDISGLTALGPTIQADTTVASALTAYRTIFTTYRVYALALPQVRYAAAADDITVGVLPRLTEAQTTLASLLSGIDSSKDSPAVQSAMADLAKQITSITTTTSGLTAGALAITPAQFNADPTILAAPAQSLLAAVRDAESAGMDITAVVDALQ